MTGRTTVVVLSAGFALVFALLEAFLVPLRIGTVPIPVSVVGAVVITPLLIRWAYRGSRNLVVAAVPAVVWVVVVLPLSVRTPSGDLVIPASAVGMAFIGLGMLAAVIGWMLCYSMAAASVGRSR